MAGRLASVVVIGAGNADRGDDGAGVRVVRTLRERQPEGMDLHEANGDMVGLIDRWASDDRVILIDAMRSGAAPGTVRRFDALRDPLPASHFPPTSTHAFGVVEVTELARQLHRLPAELTVYGIEGLCFEAGAPMSPAVEAAARRVADELATTPRA